MESGRVEDEQRYVEREKRKCVRERRGKRELRKREVEGPLLSPSLCEPVIVVGAGGDQSESPLPSRPSLCFPGRAPGRVGQFTQCPLKRV